MTTFRSGLLFLFDTPSAWPNDVAFDKSGTVCSALLHGSLACSRGIFSDPSLFSIFSKFLNGLREMPKKFAIPGEVAVVQLFADLEGVELSLMGDEKGILVSACAGLVDLPSGIVLMPVMACELDRS